MDDRLEQALAFANYRQTLNNQLHKLKIKSRGDLMFAKNGGSFTINRELINFLDYLTTQHKKETVLIDDNGVPVLVTDVTSLLNELTQRYFDVTQDYYTEYETIRKSRNVKSITDFKGE